MAALILQATSLFSMCVLKHIQYEFSRVWNCAQPDLIPSCSLKEHTATAVAFGAELQTVLLQAECMTKTDTVVPSRKIQFRRSTEISQPYSHSSYELEAQQCPSQRLSRSSGGWRSPFYNCVFLRLRGALCRE